MRLTAFIMSVAVVTAAQSPVLAADPPSARVDPILFSGLQYRPLHFPRGGRSTAVAGGARVALYTSLPPGERVESGLPSDFAQAFGGRNVVTGHHGLNRFRWTARHSRRYLICPTAPAPV